MSQIRNRRDVTHTDNLGAEWATRVGTAKCWDHAQLVHTHCYHALRNKLDLFITRVDTDKDIADLPSRGTIAFLEKMGAVEVEAKIEAPYLESIC